ncbi:UNVERIFIED_CONTAM: putative membrane-associated kinase regulator 6 [Sesamum radiatum]|uniref:Membrane-associated kinase regulator 6 n=1 Tax=Sesamum radiatum TaxID=300843 RepID=A0AAW2KRR3_SESRA
MENSQPLATESFSYSWLTVADTKSSPSDNLRPKLPEKEHNNFNFDVPVSTPPTALVHADEIFSDGQILPVYIDRSSNVLDTANIPASSPACHVCSNSPSFPPRTTSFVDRHKHLLYEMKWIIRSKSPTRILHKCLKVVVRQLCKGIGRSRESSRVDDLERKAFEVRSCRSYDNSLETSPRSSSANYSVVDIKKTGGEDDVYRGSGDVVEHWRSSPAQAWPRLSASRSSNVWFDAENSIHEAILYCKRSIGMLT